VKLEEHTLNRMYNFFLVDWSKIDEVLFRRLFDIFDEIFSKCKLPFGWDSRFLSIFGQKFKNPQKAFQKSLGGSWTITVAILDKNRQ